jgi:hypothetical protein
MASLSHLRTKNAVSEETQHNAPLIQENTQMNICNFKAMKTDSGITEDGRPVFTVIRTES